MRRTLACYAEGNEDQYVAVCLDLDIAVQGSTFDEVQRNLIDAVIDYLEYVMTLPEKEQHALLSRRAPLLDRLRFVWYAIRVAFLRDSKNSKARYEFLIPSPA